MYDEHMYIYGILDKSIKKSEIKIHQSYEKYYIKI